MGQNKIVLLLPLFVMVGLIAFGVYYINQSTSVSNEELVHHFQMEMELMQEETFPVIKVNWIWMDFPTDGLIGDDIVEVIFLNDSMEPIPYLSAQGELQLNQSGEPIFKQENMEYTDEGFAFTFPNRLEDNQMFGPKGTVIFSLKEAEEMAAYVEIKYYHTWQEWDFPLTRGAEVNQQFIEKGIEKYWVTSRSISLR